MYKIDLALNNLQWLICHQTKPNQSKHFKQIETSPILRKAITIVDIFSVCEFSSPVLTGRVSQKSEYQQVSSGLLNSSQYPG